MARVSPLNDRHLAAGASLILWGRADGDAPSASQVVESFGEIELEYAAIRRHAAILDLPHRAVIEITGDDRFEFANRMVTNEVRTLPPNRSVRAFLTNRKGRIDADLRITHAPDRLVLELDALVAPSVAKSLTDYVFAEDVTITDATESTHRIAVHGPRAAALLAAVAPDQAGAITGLRPSHATLARIGDHGVLIDRWDSTGDPGFELTMPVDAARDIHAALLSAGLPPPHDGSGATQAHPFRLRRIGWHAWNIARIEAGTPLFHLDFGPDSLPAETGVLHDRVSFTKGCYPGQEIVARMHHLGHPRQILVALKLAPPTPDPNWQPHTGAPITTPDAADDAPPIGAVTSSTRSPMCSDAIICFAQVKWDQAQPKTPLAVRTALGPAPATVSDTLHSWSRDP